MRRRGRHAFVYVFFGLLTFTSACDTDAKEDLTKEEAIIAKTIEQAESVDSYTVEGGVLEDFIWEDGSTEYNYLLGTVSRIESLQLAYNQYRQEYSTGEIKTTVFTGQIYQNEDDVYINVDDEGWKARSDPDRFEYEYTDYEAAITFLEHVENIEEMRIEETETEYEISYAEPDEFLYRLNEPPSEATKDGITFEENGSPEVFLRINKGDYTVQEFTTKFFYEDKNGGTAKGITTLESLFADINKIEAEDLEIPEEVIEEAEANE
ncbi:hypothetical protein Q5W88_12260 [Shouchella clausii]|nr:DUF6612 family protein [Shouchella clausii]MDO7283891.1 hypothetical protein [Shouchella clausii]MDO7303987.1 hypothetical protein [Shouchella clausii]PAD47824.1 hypothetical protein CHI09_03965 [Shouchella clausii]PAF09788.1 hypothetical protein CHH65_09050 [Shouchella clausii]